MIVRAGTAATFPVLFASGQPDGGVTYKIYDETGTMLGTGVITVPADAVSINVRVPSDKNELALDALLSYRDLEWSYEVEGVVINGEVRYTIEARIPFGVSADGVRSKLGVEKKDLPDAEISLAKAYLAFAAVVPALDATFVNPVIGDAIEAMAALALIPTMSVRVAVKESSGTNQYQRQDVDWAAIADYLTGLVNAGYLVVDPTYDETADYGAIFLVVTPAVDAITGA